MTETETAMNTLKRVFRADPDFAHVWHDNIAMSCHDAGADIETANEGATRFMALAFEVKTARRSP